MIELLFTVCLAHDPDICMERRLTYIDVTPTTCLARAQPELAKWVIEHPNYRISKWRCQMVSSIEIDA